MDIVRVNKLVRQSGLHNYEGCKIELENNGLIHHHFTELLGTYEDKDMCLFIKYGWPIGHDGSSTDCNALKNHNGARMYPEEVSKYIVAEQNQSRITGPYKESPFDNIAISPLNSLEKKGTLDRRIITDLSFPADNSVNSGINKDIYLGNVIKTKYPTVDHLVELMLRKGRGCLLYKRDMRKAFRQIRIDPGDAHLLCFKWKELIYCDTVLAMGLRSAAYICQRLTNSVSHICHQNGFDVINYLDDFCGVETPEDAERAFVYLRHLLEYLGIEEAKRKAVKPATKVAFLGIWFDSEAMTMEVTPERLTEIKELSAGWLRKSHATVKEVQSIIGKVNFVAKCVRPARIFIGRMLNFLREMPKGKKKYRLTDEFKGDIKWWFEYLPSFNGIALIKTERWSEPDELLASDACLTGCGATCGREYFHKAFPVQVLVKRLHINALELLALVVAVSTWAFKLAGRKVTVLCDNSATVWVINTGKTRDKDMQRLLRELCFITATNDIEVFAQHIPGEQNRIPDILSRWSNKLLRNKFLESECGNFDNDVHVDDDMFDTDLLRW